MYFERLINTIDIYHQKKIINYLKKLKIDVIIDVGAHKGEFLSYCLQLNKKFKIHCFEPQENIFQELQSKYSKNQLIKFNKIALDNIKKKKFCILVNYHLLLL
jgi:16S rRNA A1518/A1519 N6-dimethyltransferase RsmA/KsgA/DIM1 with predicted DNA glycosylase/AP lyase activity